MSMPHVDFPTRDHSRAAAGGKLIKLLIWFVMWFLLPVFVYFGVNDLTGKSMASLCLAAAAFIVGTWLCAIAVGTSTD